MAAEESVKVQERGKGRVAFRVTEAVLAELPVACSQLLMGCS